MRAVTLVTKSGAAVGMTSRNGVVEVTVAGTRSS
jgi:hypothetical protein